jgi:hypothetical protein
MPVLQIGNNERFWRIVVRKRLSTYLVGTKERFWRMVVRKRLSS